MRPLNALYISELEDLMEDLGEKKFRAEQIFRYFHQEQEIELGEAQVLPKALREKLENYPVTRSKIIHHLESKDGSRKYLIQSEDKNIVEAVFMPYDKRNTLCVSSQIGCKMGCKFCASTKADFVRNLQAEEILSQVYLAEKNTGQRVDNIVLMGIGEPFDNYDEVLRFIYLLTDEKGHNLSQRSITISTSGLVPRIYVLAEEDLSINLAISLHATSDKERAKTMPIANKYSIDEIIKACDYYFEKTGRRVSYEYVLIDGVNNLQDDIDWLANHLRGPGRHINIIPLNEIDEYDGKAADYKNLKNFQRALENKGLHATIRNKRGADIDGACGQLRIQYGRIMEDKI